MAFGFGGRVSLSMYTKGSSVMVAGGKSQAAAPGWLSPRVRTCKGGQADLR